MIDPANTHILYRSGRRSAQSITQCVIIETLLWLFHWKRTQSWAVRFVTQQTLCHFGKSCLPGEARVQTHRLAVGVQSPLGPRRRRNHGNRPRGSAATGRGEAVGSRYVRSGCVGSGAGGARTAVGGAAPPGVGRCRPVVTCPRFVGKRGVSAVVRMGGETPALLTRQGNDGLPGAEGRLTLLGWHERQSPMNADT